MIAPLRGCSEPQPKKRYGYNVANWVKEPALWISARIASDILMG